MNRRSLICEGIVDGDDDTKIYAGWTVFQALLLSRLPHDNPRESLLPSLKEVFLLSPFYRCEN